MIEGRNDLVFILDVDNTLLDNDMVKEDIDTALGELLGLDRTTRFWQIYEAVRKEEDFVDFPRTVEEWAREYNDPAAGAAIMDLLISFPFMNYLYPRAIETLQYLNSLGTAVIVSDGDQVFQRTKIRNSGLEAAVDGRVLITVHKEAELPNVFNRFPANRYVAIDDKPRILAALEHTCPAEFITVLVLQGKYAQTGEYSPAPDFTIKAIADLLQFPEAQFMIGQTRAGQSAG